MIKERTARLTEDFFNRHPGLEAARPEIVAACELLISAFRAGNKLLVCGNGGSCADSERIAGALMKSFTLRRHLPKTEVKRFTDAYGETGEMLAETLQGALPAIALSGSGTLCSALSNEAELTLIYAQQVLGYAKPGDVLLGICTSGNAQNVCFAMMTAKTLGAGGIALTGRDGGRLASLADCSIIVPGQEKYRIQEEHLAVCNLMGLYVESEMFEE
ncbi:D-sedoheptulose-7-phosphate isomerase [Acetanaerobacterium elongatum]|uniref:D-sedoheptulose 7-phosphate isomerase n=1 Tax=Acetanaerobacterium elongatum TaxID=258515 RepID=A0A1G9Z012_9FIRM|nr:SIS domain-containing protein [Acetanaerobacterium elongatum]SDN13946.1 D-sedoheptulose 7-phosphate isomerase [Acetanaerobacterium elongatum]